MGPFHIGPVCSVGFSTSADFSRKFGRLGVFRWSGRFSFVRSVGSVWSVLFINLFVVVQLAGREKHIKKLRREIRRVRQEAEVTVNEMQPQLRKLAGMLKASKVRWWWT